VTVTVRDANDAAVTASEVTVDIEILDPCEPPLFTLTGPDVASNYDYILSADSLSIPFYDFSYVKSTFLCPITYVTTISSDVSAVMSWTLDGTAGGNFVIQTTDKAYASSGTAGVHTIDVNIESAGAVAITSADF